MYEFVTMYYASGILVLHIINTYSIIKNKLNMHNENEGKQKKKKTCLVKEES